MIESGHSTSHCNNDTKAVKSEILFLGTGSSLGTPVLFHLMNPDMQDERASTSRLAAEGDPRHNRNYRCNPSLLLRYRHKPLYGNDIIEKNIVVDVGKTFREASLRWFPENGVRSVDSILLTHGHADAIFGLDDVRSLQDPKNKVPVPVYLSPECLEVVKKVFFYLFPSSKSSGEVKRMVSTLQWKNMQPFYRFRVEGLEVIPFSVKHGEDMDSMGFIFGSRNKERICYISDISRMPLESLLLIQGEGQIDILILDALAMHFEHPTHFSVQQAVALCRQIKPKKAFLVGMSSELEHDRTNKELKKLLEEEGLDIQLAYDGLTCEVEW